MPRGFEQNVGWRGRSCGGLTFCPLGEQNVGWRGRSCGGPTFCPRSDHNVGRRAKAPSRATLLSGIAEPASLTQPPLTFGSRDHLST